MDKKIKSLAKFCTLILNCAKNSYISLSHRIITREDEWSNLITCEERNIVFRTRRDWKVYLEISVWESCQLRMKVRDREGTCGSRHGTVFWDHKRC